MVKYADGPTAEVSVMVAAPPAEVWTHAADINVPARFSREFQGATWLTEGPTVGATFEGRNNREGREWSVTCTITDYSPERVFEWIVGAAMATKVARWRFDLEPVDTGTRLTFSAEMGPAPSGLTPIIEQMPDREEDIVARRLDEWTQNMTATVEGIKGLAEAGAA